MTPDAALPPQAPARELLVLRVVCAAVALGGVGLAAVRVATDPAVVSPGAPAVAVTAIALIVAALAIRRFGYSVPALPEGLPVAHAEATSLRLFTSFTLLRTAISTAPMAIAFIASVAFRPHSWLVLLLGLPGSLALFALHGWPSARTAAGTAASLESAGATSHLNRALGLPPR